MLTVSNYMYRIKLSRTNDINDINDIKKFEGMNNVKWMDEFYEGTGIPEIGSVKSASTTDPHPFNGSMRNNKNNENNMRLYEIIIFHLLNNLYQNRFSRSLCMSLKFESSN